MAKWYDVLRFWEDKSTPEQTPTSVLEGLDAQTLKMVEEQVLQKYSGMNASLADFKESFRDFKDNHDIQDHQVISAYSAIYTKVSSKRVVKWKAVEKVRQFYLAEAIIDMIVEDSLVPDITTGDILSVKSKKKEIQKRIDRINERWNLDKLVLAITPDLVAHGDYTISTEVKTIPDGKEQGENLHENEDGEMVPDDREPGLQELRDDVLQAHVVPISNFGEIEGYLWQSPENGKIEIKETADFVHFSLDSKRMRIDAHEDFVGAYRDGLKINREILKDIPRYIRVGRGVLGPYISKLQELELLESLIPASKLQKLSNGTMLGVTVPPNYDLKKGQAAAKRIEGLINKKLGIDLSKGDITLQNILNATGKVKVVPLFGDKGRMELMQTRSDEPDDLLNSVEDLRRTITGSIGVIYEIMFGGDSSKGDLLKRFARYLRLLKGVQSAICSGIKQLVMIDLANAGIDFKEEDIEVQFRNKLVEINNLDELEFADTTVQMISNIRDFIFELSDKENSPIADNIEMQDFVNYLDKQLASIGLSNLINTKVKPKSDVPGEFDSDPDGEPNDVDDEEEDVA